MITSQCWPCHTSGEAFYVWLSTTRAFCVAWINNERRANIDEEKTTNQLNENVWLRAFSGIVGSWMFVSQNGTGPTKRTTHAERGGHEKSLCDTTKPINHAAVYKNNRTSATQSCCENVDLLLKVISFKWILIKGPAIRQSQWFVCWLRWSREEGGDEEGRETWFSFVNRSWHKR